MLLCAGLNIFKIPEKIKVELPKPAAKSFSEESGSMAEKAAGFGNEITGLPMH